MQPEVPLACMNGSQGWTVFEREIRVTFMSTELRIVVEMLHDSKFTPSERTLNKIYRSSFKDSERKSKARRRAFNQTMK
jgi:hypothetical protein